MIFNENKQKLVDILINNQLEFDTQNALLETEFRCEIIRKFVDKLVSPKLFGIQPFSSIESTIYYIANKIVELKSGFELINVFGDDSKQDVQNTGVILSIENAKWTATKHALLVSYDSNYIKKPCFIDMCSDQLAIEIDRYNINNVLKSDITVHVCDFKNDEIKTKIDKINYLLMNCIEASNIIHRKTLRGPSNWIITSSMISEMFQMSEFFEASETINFGSLGVHHVGTINKRFELYRDQFFSDDNILIGRKGDANIDNGYFYNPYLIFSNTSVGNVTSDFSSGFVPNGENHYARIILKNLNFWNVT